MSLPQPKHKLSGCPMVQEESQLPSLDLSSDTDPDQLIDDDLEKPMMLLSGCLKAWICPVCQQESESGLALERHLKSLHLLSCLYPCDRYSSVFNNCRELSSHIANVHNMKKVHCKECPYVSVLRAQMRQHVCRHTHGHRCRKCTKQFPSTAALIVHEKLHLADCPDFVCDLCDTVYKTNSALLIHVTGKHGGGYLCSKCRAWFGTLIQCTRHMWKCEE